MNSNEDDMCRDHLLLDLQANSSQRPGAAQLLRSAPDMHGPLLKRSPRSPLLDLMQQIIACPLLSDPSSAPASSLSGITRWCARTSWWAVSRCWCCLSWCCGHCCRDAVGGGGGRWRRRYYVLAGQYLFRFEDAGSDRPKGTPVPVVACSFREADEDEVEGDHGSSGAWGASGGGGGEGSPPEGEGRGRGCGFVVSTIRKEYHLMARSPTERAAWLHALRTAKLRAIKEDMGHAPVHPAHAATNHSGATLFQRRVKKDAASASASASASGDLGHHELSMMAGSSGMGY